MEKPNIKTLEELYQSEYFQMYYQFPTSSDEWINNPDRMERCEEAAQEGCDGSTHQEIIDDWRECLDSLDLDDETKESIAQEIDDCEKWHTENGSIDDQLS